MLRVKRAHHYPKASEHVGDMVEQTRRLLEKGLAYEKLRLVYFRIGSFSGVREAVGHRAAANASEASTTYDYYDKDNPATLRLFKRSTLAELKAGIFWQTPWGNAGRAGTSSALHGGAAWASPSTSTPPAPI